ncbi:MAG: carbohydrate kinase family protein [Patescibacteria group bacterium]|nr:carbohydrate kinase family protein [Patescibacteria group bacterium]
MFDLISIGSISIDLYFKGDSLTFYNNRFYLALGKYVAENFYESLGGGGANVAIGVKKEGLKTGLMGFIGKNPFKKIILEKLKKEDIDYHLCRFVDNYINISTILLNNDGERSIIHYATPHQHLLFNDELLKKNIKTKAVYFGNLPDVSLTEKINLINFFKKNNVLIFLNLGVSDCRRPLEQIKKILEKIDFLIINGYEFADLVKAPFKDIHFKENVVSWYAPFLKDKIIVITLGEKGSYLYFQDKIYYQKAIKPKRIIDTTGAGDGFTAGFIAEYLKSKNLIKAMEKGTKLASKILEKIGAN